jgi:23S rRNA U2552 (ribose-2'-O)-methylase RlmE/FtsJ
VPGVIAVFGEARPDSSSTDIFAQIVASLTVLAPNGSLVLRVPNASNPHIATAAAMCERFFGTVELFRPAAMPSEDASLYLLALRHIAPNRMEVQV